jgi:hypothetical protein
MPSVKRLSSVCQSIAHHAASGLSYVHPHLRRACREAGLDSLVVSLISDDPCPERFRHIEPLRLSLRSLRTRFEEILRAEGFTMADIKAIDLDFQFRQALDDYCSICHARLVHRLGKDFSYAVDYRRETTMPNPH